MTRTSIPRLRSVRFKDGRAPLRVLRPSDDYQSSFRTDAEKIASYREAIAGYAIVVWTRDGSTSAACRSSGMPVPALMLPEFVKTVLLDYALAPPDPK